MPGVNQSKMNSMVTISITTWNSAKVIGRCLESISSQSYKNYDIIITDNNSTDNTVQITNDFGLTNLLLSKLSYNSGFCGGHNQNISKAKGEYILLVNPDVIMSPNYIEKAIETFRFNERIGTVCGLLLQNESSKIIDSAGLLFRKDFRYKPRYLGTIYEQRNFKGPTEVDGADGALPMYKRDMIDEISIDGKFFDEKFFAHKEDWDISWRSHNFGWVTYFNPFAIAIHPRYFRSSDLTLRKKIPSLIKYHSVKNQFILLVNNFHLKSNYEGILYFLCKELMVLLYVLLYEPTSLKAYLFLITNFRSLYSFRKAILKKAKTNNTKPSQGTS